MACFSGQCSEPRHRRNGRPKTVLLMANSFVINPGLKASLPYDPLGFEPVCMLANSPLVLAVNNASPFKAMAELVAAAKAKPPALTIAAVGPAGLVAFPACGIDMASFLGDQIKRYGTAIKDAGLKSD